MPKDELISRGYVLNEKYFFSPELGRLLYNGKMVRISATPLKVLRVLIEARLAGKRYLDNEDIRVAVSPGIHLSPAVVFPSMKTLRGWFGEEAVLYQRGRGYVLDMQIEPVGGLGPVVVELPDYSHALALIGRDGKVEKGVDHLTTGHRFVTILGTGGIGKTRVGLEIARKAAPHFPDGVRFVDLAPLKDMNALAGAVAAVMKTPLIDGASPAETIAESIGKRRMLLVVDTCEYLIDIASEFFSIVQRGAPHLAILATSQVRFNLPTEKTVLLKGLPVPPPEAAAESFGSAARIAAMGAVELFITRVRVLDDDFALSDDNAADVAEICRRLGGHPLSLELAATRVPAFTVSGLRESLDEVLSILTNGPRGSNPRHLSLRNVIDWSHGLLDDAQRRVFRRLAIFPSSFTGEGAKAVTGDGVFMVAGLFERSMVWLEKTEPGESPRYRLHESQLVYGREKLMESGDYDLAAERLVRYLTEIFVQAARQWEKLSDVEWLKRYRGEYDNLLHALEWAFADASRATLAIDLIGVSARLFDAVGNVVEGRRYLDRAVKLIGPDTPPTSVARLLRLAGILWRMQDRLRAVALLHQSAALYRQLDDQVNLGIVLASIGGNTVYLGRNDEATVVLAEAEQILASTDQLKSLYVILTSQGVLALNMGDTDKAERQFMKALSQARKVKNIPQENLTSNNLAEVDFARGEIDRAIRRVQEASAGLRSAELPLWLPWSLINLASYLICRGDHAEAR
ncbi:MAG: hypothetical protein QOJ54_2178, partial [Aliidongia sp.]|nr:hypothetical protein [Aliidongia sp.]